MHAAAPISRFRPTPAWLVYASLATTAVLFLSERWRWFPFNEHKGWTVLIAVAGVGVVLLLMLLWFLVALIFRRRFQFGIRTLLVLTVAVALPFSWLAAEFNQAREQRKAIEELREIAGTTGATIGKTKADYVLAKVHLHSLCMVMNLLGEDFFMDVTSVWCTNTETSDAWLQHICRWTHVKTLMLDGTRITDAGLKYIEGFNELETLDLGNTQITEVGMKHFKGLDRLALLNLSRTGIVDRGLEHLKCLTRLEDLLVDGTRVTDNGLAHLKALALLRELSLRHTRVTDAGLEQLDCLARLRGIRLDHTPVTESGIKRLQQALPNCKIEH